MRRRVVAGVIGLALLAGGCSTVRDMLGLESPGDPSVNLRSSEPRWLLIKNPRFGDVPSEPEYIWVEEDKVPTTMTTLFRGEKAVIAPPEVVAKYGPPPGGGRISLRQGVPVPSGGAASGPAGTPTPAPAASPGAVAPGSGAATGATGPASAPTPPPQRGYVVFVDTTRIAIDLTAGDGLREGSVVSLRRDRIPIVHPITGEVLGELDEEIGTARVTELRDRFSVAEIQSVAPGTQIQVKDRAVPR